MKYLILKGIEGFGDRLECLLLSIFYCKTTKRVLVIDWRDSDWNDADQNNINIYFNISGIKSMDINDFVYNKKLSVYPEIWTNKIKDAEYQKYIYTKQMRFKDLGKKIFNIANKKDKDFEQDIVLYPGTGWRTYRFIDFNNIIFAKNIKKIASDFKENHNLINKKYNCIHLRAYSKVWCEGLVLNKRLKNRIDKTFPSKEIYFNYFKNKLKELEDLPLVVVSDSMELFNDWFDFYKKGITPGINGTNALRESGIHKNKSNKKNLINNQTLRDFILMLGAENCISDNISRFSNKISKFKND